MAKAVQNAGYDVHVATRVGTCGATIEAHGFRLHLLRWRRGNLNPFACAALFWNARALCRGLGQQFDAAGRALAENRFSSARIGRETVALYHELLGRARPIACRIKARLERRARPRSEQPGKD
jgi:hypothetical protein